MCIEVLRNSCSSSILLLFWEARLQRGRSSETISETVWIEGHEPRDTRRELEQPRAEPAIGLSEQERPGQ